MTTKDLEVDLLERSRSGDRVAFKAVAAFWGDTAFSAALLLLGDAGAARDAVRDALVACWQEMPGTHSDVAFRPLLLGAVARAAINRPAAPTEHELARCVQSLDPQRRMAAILGGYTGLPTSELAVALGGDVPGAARRMRSGLKELSRCLGRDARAELARTSVQAHLGGRFFDAAVAPALQDRWLLEVRRLIPRPPDEAWGVLSDPTAIPAWNSADGARVRGGGSLVPGARIAAGGHIADRRASHDESIVTRAEPPSLLAWTTRSRVSPYPGTVEFRWSITIEPSDGGSELRHRLHGIAFPPGPIGRILRKAVGRVEESMHTSMHRGSERLAALIEART
jgi:DNA-directed RNA polymerase specialized sigma24 family protein/uncharacterized protein YndB with AHSA1/START domain